ncbi:isochorismate synthase [Allostreptomyces psammosilenae]|uniref:isochorismate synthase n=1 Tax=Allostreptomyces psammosilenae TaxID=1892865 RepID=A0A853AD32_9ACTN|nr:isochorismate synthase [Allostreptomyces psammosilenae]NYI08242.1 isochorismate synthase [Allostreptomyces psammosilenae]
MQHTTAPAQPWIPRQSRPETAAHVADLLAAYRPGGSWFLSTPRGALLARGVRASVPATGDTPLRQRVAETLRSARAAGADHPIVIGAVPFDPDDREHPPHLVVPASVQRALPLPVDEWPTGRRPLTNPADPANRATPANPGNPVPGEAAGGGWLVTPDPAPEVYRAAVAEAVRRMGAGELEKVVLSRSLRLEPAGGPGTAPLDLPRMLRALARRDPGGHTFAFDLPARAHHGATGPRAYPGPRTLIGASPELLVSRHGTTLTANPLAGSIARATDPAEDHARGQRLLASAKDRHEHAVVIRSITEALSPLCAELDVPAEPSLLRTATMWHLSTRITGRLADRTVSSFDLACAMHPTPAVCGRPTDRARRLIGELEPFERGWFTGMVGWCDADGDGEWIVTIRCAEAERDSLRLFAGAGIVVGSDPDAELAETSAKFRTFLLAAGVERPLD